VRGIVHHVAVTDAATADLSQLPALLHGAEQTLYGDQAYWNKTHRQHWTESGGRYQADPAADAVPGTELTHREAIAEGIMHKTQALFHGYCLHPGHRRPR
jgi:IS5 family transposase